MRDLVCKHCQEPLERSPDARYYFCSACDFFHFPHLDETPRAGPAAQTLQDAKCPACEATLAAVELEGYPVHSCRGCHGMLVAHANFADVVRIRRGRNRDVQRMHAPIDPRAFERRVPCPACSQTMDVHPYYGPGPVVIDTCAACGLLWLDGGEMTRIESALGRI